MLVAAGPVAAQQVRSRAHRRRRPCTRRRARRRPASSPARTASRSSRATATSGCRSACSLHADGRFAAHDDSEAVIDTFAIRRLRPYPAGPVLRRFEFYFNPDFAGGTLVVQDAYVDTIFAPAFRIRAGKGKTPFGIERLHSASNLLFIDRALPTALAPNRDLGIQVLGDIQGGVVSYLAGVMNGVPDGGSADLDTNDSKDVSGALIVRPFTSSRRRVRCAGLGLAISGSTGRQAGAAALPSFRTQIAAAAVLLLRTGAVADGTRTRYSPQAVLSSEAFGGWAEYVHTETPIRDGAVREDIAHDAWQVAGSWVLTGEAATDAGAGVRPRANFDFGNGHWGAFQVAARVPRARSRRAGGRARLRGRRAPAARPRPGRSA